MAATTPIKDIRQIAKIKKFFLDSGHIRDYALFTVGINTALRIGDILGLRWGDVYDFDRGSFRSHIEVREQKTGKHNSVQLNTKAEEALSLLLKSLGGDAGEDVYIFRSRKGTNRPITRGRAWAIFTEAAAAISDVTKFSCHSLRKTFGYHAWKSGTSSVLLMAIYNHSSFSITKRYLGIDQLEKDQVYDNILL